MAADSQYFYTGCKDNTIKAWEVPNSAKLPFFEEEEFDPQNMINHKSSSEESKGSNDAVSILNGH